MASDSLTIRAKHFAEILLLRCGPASVARRGHGRNPLVLAYHNVVPEGGAAAGDRSLHLPVADFARQLDSLAKTHEVVPLERILAGEGGGRRPLAAVTFDDAYRGAMTCGLAELESRGLPATVFVAPGRLGHESFWWDVTRDLSAESRAMALDRLQGDDARVRAWAEERGQIAEAVPDHARPATADELAALAGAGGVTFGGHSWSHRNLAALSGPEVVEELSRSLAWLQEHLPATKPWLAYPYGLDSPLARQAAASLGYTAAFRVSGGAVTTGDNAYTLPRLNVPAGVTPAGFGLRTAGLLGR